MTKFWVEGNLRYHLTQAFLLQMKTPSHKLFTLTKVIYFSNTSPKAPSISQVCGEVSHRPQDISKEHPELGTHRS